MIQLTEHDGIEMGADGEYVEVDTTSDAFRRNTTLIASGYPLRYRQGTSAASPQALSNLAQLDVATLTSVWPHGNFQGRKSGNGSNSVEEAKAPTNPFKALTAASMCAVIERTVQCDPLDVEILAEAEQVPAFTKVTPCSIPCTSEDCSRQTFQYTSGLHIHKICHGLLEPLLASFL